MTKATQEAEVIRVQEFAERLKISVWTARQWAYRGKIASCKAGKHLLIPAAEVVRIIAENMRPRISGRLFTGERGDVGGHMCGKPGTVERDGKLYCRFHDPPAVEVRKAKQQAKWDAGSAARNKQWMRHELQRKALEYLERTQPDWESKA